MTKQFQLIQERFDESGQATHDEYPFLFNTMEELRERAKQSGLANMFEHGHDISAHYFIAELDHYKDGLSFTGRQFDFMAPDVLAR